MKIMLLSLFLATAIKANDLTADEIKINQLLDRIEKSGAVFMRNGSEHSAVKAKEHLIYKMKMARKMFFFFGPEKKISVKQFIDDIASKSSTTGEEYMIKLKDKDQPEKVGTWLNEQLKEIESGASITPPPQSPDTSTTPVPTPAPTATSN